MRICVFCGSALGKDPLYLKVAKEFGAQLAKQGVGLVYGGAQVGLMGAVADAVLENGGEAIGVIPKGLWEKEVGHLGLTDLHIVDTMHQRKAKMADLADAFVALPGGVGTFEELFEVWTWAQLGIHQKAIALLNISGYYDQLNAFLEHVQNEQFMREDHRSILIVESDTEKLISYLKTYTPTYIAKWLKPSQI